jgi:hypothetical protein
LKPRGTLRCEKILPTVLKAISINCRLIDPFDISDEEFNEK